MSNHLNTAPIVGDLQQLEAAVLGDNLEGCGACVYGVLDELLQSMHWCNNNLASRNFVDDGWLQSLERGIRTRQILRWG
jgi:hypothetical protein